MIKGPENPRFSESLAQILNAGSKGDPEDLYVRLNLVTKQTDKALSAVQSLMKEQDRRVQSAEMDKVLGEVQRLQRRVQQLEAEAAADEETE